LGKKDGGVERSEEKSPIPFLIENTARDSSEFPDALCKKIDPAPRFPANPSQQLPEFLLPSIAFGIFH